MADIITKATYISIASSISGAVDPLSGVAAYYLTAATAVLDANLFDVELDLLRPFHNAYLSAESIYTSTPTSAVEAVRALQQHVVQRSTQGDVVAWCNANTIRVRDVGSSFCVVSAAAGYPLRVADGATVGISA